VVELLLRAALRLARAGALTTAAAGRHVLHRGPGRRAGLALACALFVHGRGCHLLRTLGRCAAPLGAVPDLLLLAFALVAPGFLRHVAFPLGLLPRGRYHGRGCRNAASACGRCASYCASRSNASPCSASPCCASRSNASPSSASPSSAWPCRASPCCAS